MKTKTKWSEKGKLSWMEIAGVGRDTTGRLKDWELSPDTAPKDRGNHGAAARRRGGLNELLYVYSIEILPLEDGISERLY